MKSVKRKSRTGNRHKPLGETVLDVRKRTMAVNFVFPAWEGEKIGERERLETDGTAGSGERRGRGRGGRYGDRHASDMACVYVPVSKEARNEGNV